MKLKYFNLAKQISKHSPSRFKLGAVIVKKNKILASGWNDMTKTHTKASTWGNFLHAELHALFRAQYKDTKNSVVYIYRETNQGDMANSKPCVVCRAFLKKAGVKTAYFSQDNGFGFEDL